MTMAYNFQIIEDYLKCTFREHRLFCDLSREALLRLQSIKATSVYPKGSLLCLEGQPPRGFGGVAARRIEDLERSMVVKGPEMITHVHKAGAVGKSGPGDPGGLHRDSIARL